MSPNQRRKIILFGLFGIALITLTLAMRYHYLSGSVCDPKISTPEEYRLAERLDSLAAIFGFISMASTFAATFLLAPSSLERSAKLVLSLAAASAIFFAWLILGLFLNGKGNQVYWQRHSQSSGLTRRSTRTLPLRVTVLGQRSDFPSLTLRAASAAPVSFVR